MNLSLFENRNCFRCKRSLPLTLEFFYNDKGRSKGLSHECKSCLNERKRIAFLVNPKRIPRKLTMEQRQKRNQLKRDYEKTFEGKAICRLSSYRKIDKKKGMICNLTKDDMKKIMILPCSYCGDRTGYMGADRKDNSVGHTISNCVPCCEVCNTSKMDIFTYEEMKIIGKAIAQVKTLRASLGNAVNLQIRPSRGRPNQYQGPIFQKPQEPKDQRL